MDWRHKAICRDEDPELFFPVGNSGPALAQIADAKLVCARCPVTADCLSWALKSGQDAEGVGWNERRRAARAQAAQRTHPYAYLRLSRRTWRCRAISPRPGNACVRTRHLTVPGLLLPTSCFQ